MNVSKSIYLDYNATTPVDSEVLDAMMPYFTEHFGNAASRSHMYGWVADDAIKKARIQVAEAISCDPKEVIFTSGATEANNLIIRGLYDYNCIKNTNIITLKTEHKAILDTCKHVQKKGGIVQYLDVKNDGSVEIEKLNSSINSDTFLMSIMMANNETGLIHPIENLSSICASLPIIFHTDASQALGKMAINVKNQGIDSLSISSHKIYGPKGIGALYLKSGIKIESQMDGGGHERGMRSGTLNVPAIVGFGKACELAIINLKQYQAHTSYLRDKLEAGLLQITDTKVNGNVSSRLSNITNICFKNIYGEILLNALSKISVSSGSACTSASIEPSHVLKAMGLTEEDAHSSIRFSLGKYTTEQEIEYTIKYVSEIISKLKS